MNFLQQALDFIFTAANWAGPAGLTARIVEHMEYTVIAVVASAVIAIPVGLLIGHTDAVPSWSSPGSTRCGPCPRSACCCSGCCCGGWAWCRRRSL